MADNITIKAAPARGYARLSPVFRRGVADALCAAALPVCLIALFAGASLPGVWLRLPVLFALLLLLPACWYVCRIRASSTPLVLRGGLLVALIGVSLLGMALYKASAFAGASGLAAFLAALALRGAAGRALVRGREIRVGERTATISFFDNIESLAAALVLVLLIWHFGVEAFRIPSGSMAPTLLGHPIKGDRVLVDKFTYQWRDPSRWEPVVIRYPLRRSEPYVKRCVALPGEQVLIAQGDVYVKRHDNAEIELLGKKGPAKEVLWLPLARRLDSRSEWIRGFHREGNVDFDNGWISLREDARAVYPRGRGEAPGDVVDHDASFGATEAPAGQYGNHVVGDLRIRGRARLPEDGGLELTLIRDADEFSLLLKRGRAELYHREQGEIASRRLAPELSAIEIGESVRFAFSLRDGELLVLLNGREAAREDVGTALLDQLRSRDAERRLRLDSSEAIEIAMAEPPGGRRGRIAMNALGRGAEFQIHGIERDIYYVGRLLETPPGRRVELPFGVAMGDDHYFVLGDNSASSADSRLWTRVTLFMKDGGQLTGALDDPSQPELTALLRQTGEPGTPFNTLGRLVRVAHFTPDEREDDREHADTLEVRDALRQLHEVARSRGRAAINFHTEGGGTVRVRLEDIETIQVQRHPYVERRLFVGRPWVIFLSPRGMKFID